MGEALLVRKGGGGANVTIDGVKVKGDLALKSMSTSFHLCNVLKYAQYQNMVVLDSELHVMGGGSSSSNIYTDHYKWDGTTWTQVSTLPYALYRGAAIAFNGEIHIFGGSNTAKYHYKWDGTTWTQVSTLPYDFLEGSVVVLDGEIHILGTGKSSTLAKSHYKWDGTTWTQVSTLPCDLGSDYGRAIVFNGEIHILCRTLHYKWDGTTWTQVSTLPYDFSSNGAAVFDGEIHILGGVTLNTNSFNHYKWDGTDWISLGRLAYRYGYNYGSVAVYDDSLCYYYTDSQQNSTTVMAWANIYRKAA